MVQPYLADPDVTLYCGDALETLRELPSGSVHMCCTSPPFYGLRDYGTGTWEGGDEGCDHMRVAHPRPDLVGNGRTRGTRGEQQNAEGAKIAYGIECGKCGARRVDRQIGLEESPDQWVTRLVEVFREVRRVLRDDGTFWVEIGDSYCGGNSATTEWINEANGKRNVKTLNHPRPAISGHKPKDLLMQPALLAKALRDPYYTGNIKSEVDRVWLAAMVDGEGCISIHKRPAGQSAYSSFEKADGTKSEYVRKQDSFQLKLEITNTNLALIERVIALTGEGNTKVKQEAGTHGRKQTIYRWTVTADKCRDLLRELYPHLVAKQDEARLAYGCPSSGDKAAKAHEALKALHRGEESTGIDFPAPESMFEAGWFLRSEIIWARLGPNPMPESVTDRPTKAHSTVFLLSKSPRYYFDQEAIREPHQQSTIERYRYGGSFNGGQKHQDDGTKWGNQFSPDRKPAQLNPAGANARSVWQISTEPTPFAHFATWPQALCRRMILAGTSERGVCPECGAPWVREVDTSYVDGGNGGPGGVGRNLAGERDPMPRKTKSTTTLGWRPSCNHDAAPIPATCLDIFGGSGTTAIVARKLGRRAVLIELNPDYCKLAADRLSQQSLFALEES